jgi:hypothetical protein
LGLDLDLPKSTERLAMKKLLFMFLVLAAPVLAFGVDRRTTEELVASADGVLSSDTLAINRYRSLLSMIAKECDLKPDNIAGAANATANALAKDGIRVTRLNAMEAVIRVSQEKPGIPCEKYFAAYAAFRVFGYNHHDAIQAMINKRW